MKVSVCMITYNHEKYIAQAIESVLMQETHFEYELVIGDDCSTDKTREIVLTYKEKFPEKIQLLLPERNLGMMRNFVVTLTKCSGNYVALLEGDDYWIDTHKLQKQVDILERQPDCVICAHNSQVINEGVSDYQLFNQHPIQTITDIRTLLTNSWYLPTASILFRNDKDLLTKLPLWFYKVKNGDLTLQLILTDKGGKIWYMSDVMSVYRLHSTGVSQMFKDYSTWHLAVIYIYKKFNSYSRYRHAHLLNFKIAVSSLEVIKYQKKYSKKFWLAVKDYLYYKQPLSLKDLKILVGDYIIPASLMGFFQQLKKHSTKIL